ncbi:MAG: DUF2004 domain-containing protein [Bacteroidetes bacterium]|nr:DUF2004 domain-containing protein [Bacteroidota bacterium]
MSKYILPYFGQLDTDSLDEYYDSSITINGLEINVDLNFDLVSIEPTRLEIAKRFLEQVTDFDFKNRKYIADDFNNENADTVKTYIKSHLEEMGEDELNELLDAGDKKTSNELQMLKKIKLVRLGLYPGEREQFAVFDYSIGKEYTQYLVVVVVNEDGNMEYLTMES